MNHLKITKHNSYFIMRYTTLKYITVVAVLCSSLYAKGQTLTLQDCVELALEKNITIKQSYTEQQRYSNEFTFSIFRNFKSGFWNEFVKANSNRVVAQHFSPNFSTSLLPQVFGQRVRQR